MSTLDILEQIVNIHNSLTRVTVSGDSAIIIGQSLVGLRSLAQRLGEKYEHEEKDKKEEGD